MILSKDQAIPTRAWSDDRVGKGSAFRLTRRLFYLHLRACPLFLNGRCSHAHRIGERLFGSFLPYAYHVPAVQTTTIRAPGSGPRSCGASARKRFCPIGREVLFISLYGVTVTRFPSSSFSSSSAVLLRSARFFPRQVYSKFEKRSRNKNWHSVKTTQRPPP